MKVNIYFNWALCLCMIGLLSCDGKKNKTETIYDQLAAEGLTRETDVVIDPASIKSMNEGARAILEFRYKDQGKESYASIEMDRWYHEFIAKGPDIAAVRDGKWIDFYPDLTYEYGNNEGVIGSGRFHYTISTGVILLVDNNENVKPQEFDVKVGGPVLVLVGTSTYRDNNVQMKLKMDHPKT